MLFRPKSARVGFKLSSAPAANSKTHTCANRRSATSGHNNRSLGQHGLCFYCSRCTKWWCSSCYESANPANSSEFERCPSRDCGPTIVPEQISVYDWFPELSFTPPTLLPTLDSLAEPSQPDPGEIELKDLASASNSGIDLAPLTVAPDPLEPLFQAIRQEFRKRDREIEELKTELQTKRAKSDRYEKLLRAFSDINKD